MGRWLLMQHHISLALLIDPHAIQLRKSTVDTKHGNSCFIFMGWDQDFSSAFSLMHIGYTIAN
jgi:hypothetical protein